MNYELAKKLKDAGFPQEGRGYFVDEKDNIQSIRSSGFQMYLPTLSELIEACGKRIRLLANGGNHWRAMGDSLDTDYIAGETPDEAVAKLWLALNPDSV